MIKFILAIALVLSFVARSEAAIDANATPVPKQHHIKKQRPPCPHPKRWVEVDALADDAGRPSKVECR